jgi:protein NirF
LFGEDGLAMLDLWHPEQGVRRVLDHYGQGQEKLPVYKMPHLEGWTSAGEHLFIPAVGQHTVIVVDRQSWREVARIPVHGQPVFVMARPDLHQIWVSFAFPLYDAVQVIDTETLRVVETLKPGKAVMHMEFTPRGEEIWVSARDDDKVEIYDTETFARVGTIAAEKPSGIFFSARANKIGL